MRVLHVTDASSAGVLAAITTLCREQSQLPEYEDVAFGYVRRGDTPSREHIEQLVTSRVQVFEWSTVLSPMRLVSLIRNLAAVMRKQEYDVVHLHSSRSGFLGRLTATMLGQRERTIYSPHSFAFAQEGISPFKRSAYLLLERVGARLGSNIVLVSNSEYSVTRILLPHSNSSVLSNVVDNSLYSPRNFEDRDESGVKPLVIAHVGRICEQKAPALFGDVIEKLRVMTANEDLSFSAEWLGEGSRSLLDEVGCGIAVSGWLSPEQLRRRLAAVDIVLYTSRGEGMPIALLEAQALGIPIVASKVLGVVDVIADGQTGYMASTSDELAERVHEILLDVDLRRTMGSAARQRSETAFDTRSLGRHSKDVYDQLRPVGVARA